MSNVGLVNISCEEFNHWKNVVRKGYKHIYYNEGNNGKEVKYFIKDGDNKIFILSTVTHYHTVMYYKNSKAIGEDR